MGAVGCGVDAEEEEEGKPLENAEEEEAVSTLSGVVGAVPSAKGAWSPKVARSSSSTSLFEWTATLRSLGYDIGVTGIESGIESGNGIGIGIWVG